MRFLRNLFRTEQRYFDLLEASAEEGRGSMEELRVLLNSAPAAISPDKIVQSWQRGHEVVEEIAELLCQGITGPFDPEDINLLARSLGRIPRGIKRFARRYELCAKHIQGVSFTGQFQMLETAVSTVHQMVLGLRKPKLSSTKAHHDKLQKIESEADRLFLGIVTELYQKRQEPMKALMLRDLYELLERVIDRCRTTGNIVLRIVLKHT
jgi:uncharacterized protein Yka (UPF0111/DUF47 family)